MSAGETPAAAATWADVGLAVVEFARYDPYVFVAELFALGVVLWFLVPRATRVLENLYGEKLRKHRESREPPLPLEGGHDG